MAMVWAGRQQSTVGNVTIARNGLCYAARPWEWWTARWPGWRPLGHCHKVTETTRCSAALQSDDTHTLKYSNVSTSSTNIKIFQLESQLAGAMGTCREIWNPMIILGTVKNIMIFKVVVNQLDNPVYGGSPTPPQSAPVLLTLKSIMLIHSQQ